MVEVCPRNARKVPALNSPGKNSCFRLATPAVLELATMDDTPTTTSGGRVPAVVHQRSHDARAPAAVIRPGPV